MAANASERAQRQAVLDSTMWEFAGWRLAVDCGTRECGGELYRSRILGHWVEAYEASRFEASWFLRRRFRLSHAAISCFSMVA